MGKQAHADGHKPLDLRLAHLHRAAVYLSRIQGASLDSMPSLHSSTGSQEGAKDYEPKTKQSVDDFPVGKQLGRHLNFQLKDVAMKAQIRLTPAVKHSMCQRCGLFLGDAGSVDVQTQNPSLGGRKPWAAIQVIKCTKCGHRRRVPVCATRQPRKGSRATENLGK